jgi:hypothetical protein
MSMSSPISFDLYYEFSQKGNIGGGNLVDDDGDTRSAAPKATMAMKHGDETSGTKNVSICSMRSGN